MSSIIQMMAYIEFLRTKRIAIVGMAKSGKSAFRLLSHLLQSTKNFVTFDEKLTEVDFSDSQKLVQEFKPNLLLVTPGYPLNKKWIQDLVNSGALVMNEIDLASHFLKNEKLIAVTGSVGKSTTVALIGEALRAAKKEHFVGGNFGTPLCDYIFEICVQSRTPAEWVVLELSSYHLESLQHIHFYCSVITNFTSNHLERYPTKMDYFAAKWKIVNLTNSVVYISKHSQELWHYYEDNSNKKVLGVSNSDLNLDDEKLSQINLLGGHNRENLSLAFSISRYCNWGELAEAGMLNFRGLPHRMENLGMHNNRFFINDSKSTTIESVKIAVIAMQEFIADSLSSKLILLLGGRDKNLPWQELKSLLDSENIKIVYFGECGKLSSDLIGIPGLYFSSLKLALLSIDTFSRAGDYILLSPGGTSLDEFKNFEERGDFFREFVLKYLS